MFLFCIDASDTSQSNAGVKHPQYQKIPMMLNHDLFKCCGG